MRNLVATDPESFRGKLYLLIVDKLVIGAVLAAAFVAYSWWAKQETRHYEQRLRNVDLAFRRAEYLKEMVPIVTDSKQDALVRAELLTALIETQSVDDKSAFTLAERVLRAGLIRSDYPSGMVWHQEHFLLDALLKRMPGALESLLNHYMVNSVYVALPDEFQDPSRQNPRDRYDVAEFWRVLFRRTVETYGDAQLQILDDDRFLNQYLPVLYQLGQVRGAHGGAEVPSHWRARKPKGLQILAALSILREGPDDEETAERYPSKEREAAVSYLADIVDPVRPTPEGLEFSSTLLRVLAENTTQDRLGAAGLLQRCATIVLTAAHSPNGNETEFRLWSRANAASDYMIRSAQAGWHNTVLRATAAKPGWLGEHQPQEQQNSSR